MTGNDLLIWLQNWYASQCNGEWEHSYGIHIGTLDNPGWTIDINLRETELENKFMNEIEIERSDDDWIDCFIRDKHFKGNGGPHNLIELLTIFKDWATH